VISMLRRPPSGMASRGVQGQVEHGALHLSRVGQSVPQTPGDNRLHLDALADRAAEHLGHVGDLPTKVHHLGLQGLAPREGEQLAGQLGGAVGAVQGVLDPLLAFAVLHVAGDQLEIAADDLQDVVEVVRHPAGQVAHRFHALRPAPALCDSSRSVTSRDEPTTRSTRPSSPRTGTMMDSQTRWPPRRLIRSRVKAGAPPAMTR